MTANRESISAGGEQREKPAAVPIDDVYEPVTDLKTGEELPVEKGCIKSINALLNFSSGMVGTCPVAYV